ncbi:MAG: hypothetical protein F6K28_18155 [Microcoleus sp. SIO2G3]|nr:hypothetical protein [Microcoleus sp. SIO2G3]
MTARLANIIPNFVQDPTVEQPSIASTLKKVLQYFISFLKSDQEIQIWTTTDHYENILWHAYNPLDDTRIILDSEEEMLRWVEQGRHLQN